MPVKIRGNKPYARWKRDRLFHAQSVFNQHVKITPTSSNVALITLTADPSQFRDAEESWKHYKEELPKFMRKLKRIGVALYMYNVEAHLSGFAHAHVLVIFKEQYQCFRHKNVLRNSNVSTRVKKLWTFGYSDVVMGKNEDVSKYLTLEVGKYFQIEDAIKRAQKGEATHNDAKAILTHYYASRHNMRLFNCSRELSKKDDKDTDRDVVDCEECLDYLKNNSTVIPISYGKLSEILGYRPPPFCHFNLSYEDNLKLLNYIASLGYKV